MFGTKRMTRVVVRARQEAAVHLARKLILSLFYGTVLQIAVGCTGIGESAAADATPPPLTVYPNQIFSTGKPGQLGLYIEGEDWHLLVDMPGFEQEETVFTAPSQFLFMRNANSETTLSVFAERISGADSTESCRRYYAAGIQQARDKTARLFGEWVNTSEVSQVETHGKLLLVFDAARKDTRSKFPWPSRKSINWFPFYRGFCFHFHFDASGEAAVKEVLNALDSLTYVSHQPRDVDIDRLFYFHRLRIRLSIPIGWQYIYRRPPPGPAGGIEILPSQGHDFTFLLIPFGKTGPSGQQPKDQAEESHARFASRSRPLSSLNEVCTGDTCLYSFDVTDNKYDMSDPRSFPYWRHTYAKIGNQFFLGLSLGYRDKSKDAAERISAALSRAKVLDLSEARKAFNQGQTME